METMFVKLFFVFLVCFVQNSIGDTIKLPENEPDSAINASFIGFKAGKISTEDEVYWNTRAEEALKVTKELFDPNPEIIINYFNIHIHQDVNDTRRSLIGGHHKNLCKASNPIDRCWRCRLDWADDRQRLADCPLGFGHKTRGGQGGKTYIVTDCSDNDVMNPVQGTLRHAVIQKEPLWIVFARPMSIRLQQELIVQSDKTIDGRGYDIHIAHGAGITIQFVKNVIIHGLQIHNIIPAGGGLIRDSVDHLGLRTASDGDGISVFGSSNIWLDHLTMTRCADGLIDVIHGSTAVTISNCLFTNHNDVMLCGASDSFKTDEMMQVTVAFNHFGTGLIQRMPRCRFGFCHVVNNQYTKWEKYAIGGSSKPTILSQGNKFLAPDNPHLKEITKRFYAPEEEWKTWNWISKGDIFLNGAYFTKSGDSALIQKFDKMDLIKAKAATNVAKQTRLAGALNCTAGQKC